MISCPNCNATLPDGASQCQFCHTAFAPARVARDPNDLYSPVGNEFLDRYAWLILYILAGWWIVDGIYHLVSVLIAKQQNSFIHVMGTISLLQALIGVGLIARVDVARPAARVLSWIGIVGCLFGILLGILIGSVNSSVGDLIIALSAFELILDGVMLYFLCATDTRLPIQ